MLWCSFAKTNYENQLNIQKFSKSITFIRDTHQASIWAENYDRLFKNMFVICLVLICISTVISFCIPYFFIPQRTCYPFNYLWKTHAHCIIIKLCKRPHVQCSSIKYKTICFYKRSTFLFLISREKFVSARANTLWWIRISCVLGVRWSFGLNIYIKGFRLLSFWHDAMINMQYACYMSGQSKGQNLELRNRKCCSMFNKWKKHHTQPIVDGKRDCLVEDWILWDNISNFRVKNKNQLMLCWSI